MTKLEAIKCEKLLDEAIRNAEVANNEFYKAGNSYDTTERHILETKACLVTDTMNKMTGGAMREIVDKTVNEIW